MGNKYEFSNFIGKDLNVKINSLDHDVTCRLEGYNEAGIFLSYVDSKSPTIAKFQNRFYPWMALGYFDVIQNVGTQTRVA